MLIFMNTTWIRKKKSLNIVTALAPKQQTHSKLKKKMRNIQLLNFHTFSKGGKSATYAYAEKYTIAEFPQFFQGGKSASYDVFTPYYF